MSYCFNNVTKTLSVMVTRGEHATMMEFRSQAGRAMEEAIKALHDKFANEHGECKVELIVKNEA